MPAAGAAFHNPNTEWHAQVQDAMDKIIGKWGQEFPKSAALGITDGGTSAPVDLVALKTRFDDTATWSEPILMGGGVNALWTNPMSSLTPNVSINMANVEKFIQNTWPAGTVKPLAETIDFRAEFPLHLGCLTRLSPEEPQQALIIHVGRRIATGADEGELEKWRRILLSSTGRFVRAETWDDMYFWVTNARRRFKDAAAAIVHLATQIICDIWMFKTRKEAQLNKTMAAKDIADAYQAHMHDATTDTHTHSHTHTQWCFRRAIDGCPVVAG